MPAGYALLRGRTCGGKFDECQPEVLDRPHHGFPVLESIKRIEALRRLPAVVMTGSDDGEHVLRAYDLPANGYVVKSADLDTMRERIKGAVRFWQRARLPSHVRSQ